MSTFIKMTYKIIPPPEFLFLYYILLKFRSTGTAKHW